MALAELDAVVEGEAELQVLRTKPSGRPSPLRKAWGFVGFPAALSAKGSVALSPLL
jgi:hypothetical protein